MQSITKENLFKDRFVLGKNWNKTYKGYFSDPKVLDVFANVILKLNIPKNKVLNILYVCSGTGLLGEYVCSKLQAKGYETKLTLLESSKDQLQQNKNKKTKKICIDLLEFKSKTKYDLIIMRSSLDYFSKLNSQVKALKIIKGLMKTNALFVNQCAAFPTIIERNLADKIYASNNKIGKRHFQSNEDISEIYGKSGFKNIKLIKNAPIMKLTEKEHIERYKITKKEVIKIQNHIISLKSKNRPNIDKTKSGYRMNFNFPIYFTKN